ncbi:hydrogenase maturation nickel metallochaperone HypA [soil metagenome]
MHELSLCEAILNHVEERVGDRPVRRVEVRIGHLRQVVPDALMFSWEMLTECSGRTGCELVVEHIPAVVRCRACGIDTTLDWPVLACATCESHDVELRSGNELDLAWIEVPSGDVASDEFSSDEVTSDDVSQEVR